LRRAARKEVGMTISGISASMAAPHQSAQMLGLHKHGHRQSHSLTDIDAQGSSVAPPPSVNGTLGSRVDMTA
jgi:hypothetical protein